MCCSRMSEIWRMESTKSESDGKTNIRSKETTDEEIDEEIDDSILQEKNRLKTRKKKKLMIRSSDNRIIVKWKNRFAKKVAECDMRQSVFIFVPGSTEEHFEKDFSSSGGPSSDPLSKIWSLECFLKDYQMEKYDHRKLHISSIVSRMPEQSAEPCPNFLNASNSPNQLSISNKLILVFDTCIKDY